MRKIKFNIGDIYHIYNRGVEKRNIFNNNSDRWRFLQGMFLFNDKESSLNILYHIERENKGRINFNLLREFIKRNKSNRDPLVKIIADCLMPNHFHLIIQEIRENGISQFMHKFGIGYTKYFNTKYDRVGSLFQGTFKAVKIDNDEHLKYLLIYINVINPGQLIEPNFEKEGVKDINNIINFAENYEWSTNKEYLGIRDSIIIDKGLLGKIFPKPEGYKRFVNNSLLSKKYNIVDHIRLEN